MSGQIKNMQKSKQSSRREFLAGSAVALAGFTLSVPGFSQAESQSEVETSQADFPVAIRVDAKKTNGELRPIWRFFGADEPNYAYMKNGKKLLSELGALGPKKVFFRTPNLITSG